jgi:hypothetical protein
MKSLTIYRAAAILSPRPRTTTAKIFKATLLSFINHFVRGSMVFAHMHQLEMNLLFSHASSSEEEQRPFYTYITHLTRP